MEGMEKGLGEGNDCPKIDLKLESRLDRLQPKTDMTPERAEKMLRDLFSPCIEQEKTEALDDSAWRDKLDPATVDAFRGYTSEGTPPPPNYKNINQALRGKDDFEPGGERNAQLMEQALSDAHLPENCTVYRTITKETFQSMLSAKGLEFPKDLACLKGEMLMENGFLSTSLSKTPVVGGDVKMEISAPAGSPGALISKISEFPGEKEVLFAPGQMLKIADAYYDQHDESVLKIELLIEEGEKNE